jgi:hypothetical protein
VTIPEIRNATELEKNKQYAVFCGSRERHKTSTPDVSTPHHTAKGDGERAQRGEVGGLIGANRVVS